MASKLSSNDKKSSDHCISNSGDGSKESSGQQYLFGKMSKKLAQLTKLGRDTDLRKQIEDLERRVQDAEHQKQELVQELEITRHQFEENKKRLEESTLKINEILGELGFKKQELENQVNQHHIAIKQLQEEASQKVDSIQCEHQSEIERILKMNSDRDMLTDTKMAQLESNYRDEIQQLSLKCAEAVAELAKLREEQMSRVNEIRFGGCESIIGSNNNNKEDAANCETNMALEADVNVSGDTTLLFLRQNMDEEPVNDQYVKRIADLENENTVGQQEIQCLEEKNKSLQVIIDENSEAIVSLSIQLAEARDECQDLDTKLGDAIKELSHLKAENALHVEELQKKGDRIEELVSKNLLNKNEIKRLTEEIQYLKDTVKSLQEQIETLQSQMKVAVEGKEQEIQTLKQLCDDTVKAKKEIQEKFEKEFEQLRNFNAEREQQLLEDCEWKLREVYKDSKTISTKLQENQHKLQEEYERMISEKETQAAELQKCMEELQTKMSLPEAELRQLRGFTDELQKGIKVASSQVDQMRLLEIRLREDLRDTKYQLQEAKENAARLQKEVIDTKNSCERRLKAKEVNLKKSYEEQLRIATNQWNLQIEKESQRIKEELEEQYNVHKLASLAELALQKDQEMASLIIKYEKNISDLSQQLAHTTKSLENTEKRLNDEIELTKMSGNLKIAEFQRKLEEKEDEIHKKGFEVKTKDKLVEDLQTQLTAHRATLDLVREEADKLKEEEIIRIKNQLEQQIGSINQEWTEKLQTALEVQSQSHKSQILTARIELEKAMELSNEKEKEQKECITDLNEALNQKDEAIRILNEEIQRLQTGLSKMSKELEFHGREILRVKNEASRQLSTVLENCSSNTGGQRSEDKIAIRQLREALLDKDRLVKKLQEEKKILQMELMSSPLHSKRLSASQPVVNSGEPLTSMKRNRRLKEVPKRLSAPVLSNFDVSSPIFTTQVVEEKKGSHHTKRDNKRRSNNSTNQHSIS